MLAAIWSVRSFSWVTLTSLAAKPTSWGTNNRHDRHLRGCCCCCCCRISWRIKAVVLPDPATTLDRPHGVSPDRTPHHATRTNRPVQRIHNHHSFNWISKVHCPCSRETRDHCAQDGPFKMCANSCACAQLIWARYSGPRQSHVVWASGAASGCLGWLKSRRGWVFWLRRSLLGQRVGLALWSDSDGKWRVHVLCHFAAIWCIVTNILRPAAWFVRPLVRSWFLIRYWAQIRSGRVVKTSLYRFTSW